VRGGCGKSNDVRTGEGFGAASTIDSRDGGAAALAFEAEPAVPGADVDDAFPVKIAGQPEDVETAAQLLDRLETGENTAVRKFDRVVADTRLHGIRHLPDALFKAGIAGRHAQGFFFHPRPSLRQCGIGPLACPSLKNIDRLDPVQRRPEQPILDKTGPCVVSPGQAYRTLEQTDCDLRTI